MTAQESVAVARREERNEERNEGVTRAPSTSTTVGFVQRIEEYWRLAQMLSQSGMVGNRTPQACMAILLQAHEVGIPAMQAFRSIHFFDGKLVTGADLMASLAAERCRVRWRMDEWGDEVCRATFYRPGWEPITAEFTMKDAQRAGLTGKDNWKKYPKDMLRWRCLARGIRTIAPDHFSGWHIEDEQDTPVVRAETATGAPQSRTDAVLAKLGGAPAANGATEAGEEQEGAGAAAARDLLASQTKSVLEWVARTTPAGKSEPADDVRESAREAACQAFEGGAERETVLAWIDNSERVPSESQLKHLATKLKIVAQARSDYEQPSVL